MIYRVISRLVCAYPFHSKRFTRFSFLQVSSCLHQPTNMAARFPGVSDPHHTIVVSELRWRGPRPTYCLREVVRSASREQETVFLGRALLSAGGGGAGACAEATELGRRPTRRELAHAQFGQDQTKSNLKVRRSVASFPPPLFNISATSLRPERASSVMSAMYTNLHIPSHRGPARLMMMMMLHNQSR